MNNRRVFIARFLLPALALLPMLLLGGGMGDPGIVVARPIAADTSASPAAQETETLVIRVYFRDTAERDRLATELGADEIATTGGFLTIWTDHDTYNDLVARGLRVEIDEKATKEANTPIIWGNTFYGGYRTVEEMQTFLDQKVAAYPTLVEKVDIGDSWCKTHPGQCTAPNSWNGFDLWVLHISNQAVPGPKPVYWFDTGIHSREIATSETSMFFIDWLLTNYNTNPDAHWLVDYHDIWIMPMLNPDGHHIVEFGNQNPVLQRKNADKDDGCPSYPNFGTDLNRNFPFLWGCCGGSSGSACSETYRGPSAGSEEETQAVMAKIRTLIPDQRGPNNSDPAPLDTTGIIQSMHSYANLNLYPWGWTNSAAPNGTDLGNIARHMSATNANPPGNNYVACQPGICLYNVDGDSFDWSYGELGVSSYTTEVSGNSFFPSYSTTQNVIWPENRGQLTYMAKIARTPYLFTHGPDANTVATNPNPVPQGTNSRISGTINYAWTANSYTQNVAAAEYYIDTPPWAGGTAVPMSAVDGSFNSPTEQVQADIDTTAIPVGRHIVFVRGRGVNDYGGFQSWGPVSAAWLDVSAGGTVTPSTATSTVIPPTVTLTVVPPTLTGTIAPPTVTNTVVPSVTNTVVPPTLSSTVQASSTVGASATIQASATVDPTNTIGATNTVVPPTNTIQPTPTICPIQFSDVPSTDTFYSSIRCLACRGIVSGYSDGTFRPNNQVTRGQLAKMVSNAAGFSEPVVSQTFEDVTPANTFYEWIERLTTRGYMTGYVCGGPGEPCTTGKPYFRPYANATRGQTSKIVSNAAVFTEPPVGQTFEDVPSTHTFYEFIQRLATRDVMQGYPCGGLGEPCTTGRPYFRPGNDVTRGQSAKIVANAFYPNCETP